MKNHVFFRCLVAIFLAIVPLSVFAENELSVFVARDGAPLSDAMVTLDGSQQEELSSAGLAELDLSSGGHSLQVLLDGQVLHTMRLDSADGQYVDVAIMFDSASDNPQTSIEHYFLSESVSERANAPQGVYQGRVFLSGAVVEGAIVELEGIGEVVTDADGQFSIEAPRGVYSVNVFHDDASRPVEGKEVRLVSHLTQSEDVYLASGSSSNMSGLSIAMPEVGQIEEAVIIATVNLSSFGESEEFSSGVVNTMGIEELARFGGSDVAASIGRMPAITVQDDKYVFIRGLGGRYITTTLNGSTMPSTDPTKRTVPLDLFPSNMVQQLDILKTFQAGMPGESTGGNLVINTRAFPDQRTGKISVSLGGNTAVTGKDVAVDPIDGDFDFFGFEDGSSRKEPSAVSAIAELFDSEAGDELSANQETKLNHIASIMLLDDMDLVTDSADPDFSLGANYGDVFYIGDAELGFFAAGNYSNEWSRQTDGIERTYLAGTDPGTVGDVANDFVTDQAANVIDLSGMLSIGLNIGDSSYESVTMISRNTENSVKTTQGRDGDSLNPTQYHTIIWEERQFVSQQFRGEHYFNALAAEWQVTGSQAWRYAPDRREVRFNQNSENSPYVLNVADAGRRWDELEDNNLDGSFDLDWDLQINDQWDSRLEFGAQAIHRERETESATYGWLGNRFLVDVNSPNLQFSEVINLDTITGDQATGFAFNEETLASDEYDAEMDLNSVYLSAENSYNNLVDVIVGVRYEDFQQVTDTFELAGAQEAVQSTLDQTETLPSLGINWYYTDGQQLRFAASQTVSRPDFKETSNAVFYDDEFSDVRVRGNPLLKISSINNYDLRWEYYGEYEDTLKVALFYKDIENAIERVALTASGTAGNSRTFSNADSAELYGLEIDARRDFPLNEGFTQSVFVSGNAAIIESESMVVGQPVRKLQGQPDYTLNLIFGWDDLEHNQEFTLLFNQNGESIRDVGISGQPDIIQEPRLSVNFNYSIALGANGTLQAKLNNLLDTNVEYTQGGQVFRQYGDGRSFSISYDWQF
mgnify:CR=1 FL=1